MTTQEITKVIKNLKVNESKLFDNGVEVWKDKFDDVLGWQYSAVSSDGDTGKDGISLNETVNMVTSPN